MADLKLLRRDKRGRLELLQTLGYTGEPVAQAAEFNIRPGDKVRVTRDFAGPFFDERVGRVDDRASTVPGCVMVIFHPAVQLERFARSHISFRPGELVPASRSVNASLKTDKPTPAPVKATIVEAVEHDAGLHPGLLPFHPARPSDAESARRDPFQFHPETIDRGNRAHEELVYTLAALALERQLETCRITDGPDLDLAWTAAGRDLTLIEVKSLTPANESRQIRLGLGQLLDYAHSVRLLGPVIAALILAVEREPSDTRFGELCRTHGVMLVWPATFDAAFAGALED